MRNTALQRLEKSLFAIIVFVGLAATLAEAAVAGVERRAQVPEELRGDWLYGTISPSDFHDRSTGQHVGNGVGVGVWFTFDADGGFKKFQYNHSMAYSCRIETWTVLEGTVAFADGSFKTYPTSGKVRVANSCAKSQNYTRPITEQERADGQGTTYTWGFERYDGDGKTYLLIGPAGTETRSQFRRP